MKSLLRAISTLLVVYFLMLHGVHKTWTGWIGDVICNITEIWTASHGQKMNGEHNVHCLILFLFRGGVPAASAGFHGETLPGVWWLWWEQAQLHSNLQWIRESLGSSLLHDVTPTSALKKTCENLTQDHHVTGTVNLRHCYIIFISKTVLRSLVSVYRRHLRSNFFFFCRLVCWRSTWSSSWCRGSLDLTWTHS